MAEQVDWDEIKKMEPYMRYLTGLKKWEASVGTGFETSWWPEGFGDTEEEARSALRAKLDDI